MAKETPAKNLSLDEILSRIEETETLKQQAIEMLLKERQEIDRKIAKLGYASNQTKAAKKRHRRTRAEIEAAKAEGSEAHG